MNTKTPHAMNWAEFPLPQGGKEVVATMRVLLRVTDPLDSTPTSQIVEQLRKQMAEVLDCPLERINAYQHTKGQG